MNPEIIKICKICKINNNVDHKFRGPSCIKCQSKKNNERLKAKDYYKTYWLDIGKEKANPNHNKVGRPKKCLEINL